MYEWNWVYSRAQLQLLSHDFQFTAYKATEKKGHHDGKYHKPDKEKIQEAYRKWKLRKAQGAFNLKKFLGDGYKDTKQAQSSDTNNKPTEK